MELPRAGGGGGDEKSLFNRYAAQVCRGEGSGDEPWCQHHTIDARDTIQLTVKAINFICNLQ